MYHIEEVKLKKSANTNNVDSRPMILAETPTDKVLRHVLDQLLSRLSFETRQHLSADHLVKPSKMETNHSDPSITDENSGIPLTVTTTIRHVQSHPSMAPSPTGPGSTRSLGNLNKDIMSHGSRASNATSSQHSSTKQKISPDNRSPTVANSMDDAEEVDEDGAHDTITSLAGAKMLQRYRRAISGSHKGSASSLNQQNRLEDLFLIEEDAKDVEDSEAVLIDQDLEQVEQVPITAITAELFVPPDGGYGWLIAFGAFNALFWTAGMVKSYGVIFDLILKTFPESSVTLAAWIPASMTTLALAMAPFASALCQRFNCRNVTFVGSILCFIGISMSSFAQNVETLFATFGICTGLGIGLSTTPGIILVARYFDKRRGIANAFCLSGTAAGSLCLPFLIETLARAFAFQGTLLLLGACMLHISISAALYRPLAIHVLITKQKEVVNLQEATEENLQEQQELLLNKDNNHDFLKPKKLQNQCYHHHSHQHHPYDPDDVVAKLQTKLTKLDDEIQREMREDSVSIHSSVSQKQHHHHRGHVHHHHHQHHHHSGHTTPKHKSRSGQHTPLHHSGQHTPVKHMHPGLGYRHSFASMAVSLPPGLDYYQSNYKDIYTPTNSSFTSREDLQCTWHDLPRFDIGPPPDQDHPDTNQAKHHNSKSSKINHSSCGSTTQTNNNLSSLFMHQVEMKLNQYKNMLIKNRSKTQLRSNVASFLSVGSAAGSAKDPGPSVSRQASISNRERNQFEQQQEACLKAKNNTLRRRNSSGFQRSTLNFCFEDMTTDSTSVLKDCRHPSLSSVHLSSSSSKPSGPTIGRVVSLHRTNTTVSVQPSIRPRYLSEGHEASKMNSKDNLHSSKLFICTPTATAATNDNVFQNSHKSGSSLCVSMDFEFQSIVGLAPAASIVVDNAAEGALEEHECGVGGAGELHQKAASREKKGKSPLRKFFDGIANSLDLKLVKEPLFLMMVASVTSMSVGVPHVLFFIPTYVRSLAQTAGVDLDPAVLLSATSIADLAGRIAFGVLLDRNWAPKHIIYAMMILICGSSVIGLAIAQNSTGLAISMLLYGLGSGAWFLMVPLLLADYLGVERIGASYGLIRLFQAGSNLIGPIVGGVLSDKTGSFAASFIVMGTIMNLGAIGVFFKPLFEQQTKSNSGCVES